MFNLPDFSKAFEYENNFYLSCDNTRLSKILAHYELFKATMDLPGEIVECGVFKGASFVRFAGFRDLFCNPFNHKLIGFDIFGKFPVQKSCEVSNLRCMNKRGIAAKSLISGGCSGFNLVSCCVR